jgi:ATP-binding cassette, subfamily B, bacterial
MKSKQKLFRFFVSFILTKRKLLVIPVSFALFMALQESITPYLIKTIIDQTNVFYIDNSSQNIWSFLIGPVIAYFVFTEITNIVFRLKDYFKLKVFPEIRSLVIYDAYSTLLGNTYEFFQNSHTGSLVNKISDLMRGIEILFTMIIDLFLWRILSLIIAIFALYFAHPFLCLFVFGWSICFILLSYKLSKKATLLSKSFSESRSKLFGVLSDSLSNLFNITLFNNQKHEQAILTKQLQIHTIEEKKMLKKALSIGFIQGLFVSFFTAIVLVALVIIAEKRLITIGDFAFVLTLSSTIIKNVYSVSSDLIHFSKEVGICLQALNIYDDVNYVKETNDPVIIKNINGDISIRNIGFSYNKLKINRVFDDLSVDFKAKQHIGIVGVSGVGKTTLVNLILRLFDVQAGGIYLDNVNIKDLSLGCLRDNLAVIPQEPFLFNRTIRDNILFGNLNATNHELNTAIKDAQLERFIHSLPDGLDTMVGERGLKLSGGQKQRIAIARALLKNAQIILMDEPTSALDSETESSIFKATKNLLQNKTAIVIAHRLSTLASLDKIFVFDKKGIAESGSHIELLDNNGIYTKLWKKQDNIVLDVA